jgi:hypothetical protein
MSTSVKPIIVLLIGAGLQLPPTDASAAGSDRVRGMVSVECHDAGAAEEIRVSPAAVVPPVSVTELAQQRAPEVAAQAGDLASQVQTLAAKSGLVVREMVLRGDWSEEGDTEYFRGVVLDIFAGGETETRLQFWVAVAEALSGVKDAAGVQLSVMVHGC